MAVMGIAPGGARLLRPDGQPFYIHGANYEGYHDRTWRMWEPGLFDLELIERDFQKAQNAGLNCLRLFVQRALADEIDAHNFGKLDSVLELARRYDLYILLALNDDHNLNLEAVAAQSAKIATHYRDEPMIMAYDLENEPRLYNLAAAIYPASFDVPLRSQALIEHYGERVSRAEALERQQQGRIPRHLSPDEAYYYANAVAYFIEWDGDAGIWRSQHGGNVIDYMLSPDSAEWQPYITALSGTLALWIKVQRDAIRAADPHHLLTVGYNWGHLAGLEANRVLDFHQFHHYPSRHLYSLRFAFGTWASLKTRFPGQPVMLGEFGYSNQTSYDPSNSQPVSEDLTAIYEGAAFCYMRANNFAGTMKWMLNDVRDGYNPYEDNLGIYADDDRPKKICELLRNLASVWARSTENGTFALQYDPGSGAGYIYKTAGAVFAGGTTQQDEAVGWRSTEEATLFLNWSAPTELQAEATNAGEISVSPAALVPGWPADQNLALYQRQNGQHTKLNVFPAGTLVTWQARPDLRYSVIPTTEPVPGPPTPPPTVSVWYFAEGATHPQFEMWIYLMNPNAQSVEVTLTFMKRDGSTVVRRQAMPPTSRASVRVNDFLPGQDLSVQVNAPAPVFAQRAMYFRQDGHSTSGIAEPGQRWYFAEGATHPEFDTWILLQNPGTTAANARLTFAKDDGTHIVHEVSVLPRSRQTIFVDLIMPNANVSTLVESDRPIVAERAMYFLGGGHAMCGTATPGHTWYLPAVETKAGFDTFLLVYNPNQTPANLTFDFFGEDGSVHTHRAWVRENARFTLHVNLGWPGRSLGARLRADQPVAAERATYFANKTGGHGSVGAAQTARIWNLPGGSTLSGAQTEIVLLNPEPSNVGVMLTLMKEDGTTTTHSRVVPPTSRLTVPLAALLPNARFAVQVRAEGPIVAEEVVYFNNGQGGTAAVGTPQ
jgi:hypothetical protein